MFKRDTAKDCLRIRLLHYQSLETQSLPVGTDRGPFFPEQSLSQHLRISECHLIVKDLQGIISYRPSDQGGISSLRCSNLRKSEYNLNHLSFSKRLKQRRARCLASPRTGETRRQENQWLSRCFAETKVVDIFLVCIFFRHGSANPAKLSIRKVHVCSKTTSLSIQLYPTPRQVMTSRC